MFIIRQIATNNNNKIYLLISTTNFNGLIKITWHSKSENGLQVCAFGEYKIYTYNWISVHGEHDGNLLQFVSTDQVAFGRRPYSISYVHILHVDADIYLLLVWKQSQSRGISSKIRIGRL